MKTRRADRRRRGLANGSRGGHLALVVLTVLAASAAQLLGFLLAGRLGLEAGSVQSALVAEVCAALPAALFTAVLIGPSQLTPLGNDVRFAFRFGWWLLAVSAGVAVISLVQGVSAGSIALQGWPARLAQVALTCLAVGVFEECVFRGLIFNGLMEALAGKPRGALAAAVATSVLFGIAHLGFPGVDAGPVEVASSLLFAAQMFMYSMVLCAVVLRTQRLVGACLLHALDDLILAAPSTVFMGMPFAAGAIPSSGDTAALVMQIAVLCLYAPLLVKALRSMGAWA